MHNSSLEEMDSQLSNNKELQHHSPTTTTILTTSVTPNSDGTSFFTAKSRTNSTIYHSVDSTPSFLLNVVDDENDEEIDYSILNANNDMFDISNKPISPPENKESDTESVKTVRPSDKGKAPMASLLSAVHTETPPLTPSPPTQLSSPKRQRKKLYRKKKPLFWRRSGVLSQQIPTIVTPDPTGKIIKREPILCMQCVSGCNNSVPTRYKAAKEARYNLLTEKWRQVELVLTDTFISTYSASSFYWPNQKLEHRIFLVGPRRPKKLELYLLSPLDYSFCLRYQTYRSSRLPIMVTMMFKAKTFSKCQEWYMQLYHTLPNECKRSSPQWCEVYIPLLDLSVNLPLANVSHPNRITMEDVKDTVISVLEEEREEEGNELLNRLVTRSDIKHIVEDQAPSIYDLGLCWTHEDRAEWIYWTHSSSDPEKRIDTLICPQSIENTHRLELRMIEHTPNNIILQENVNLIEPPSVEGFMIYLSDFHGSLSTILANRKLNYFATFDHYLFYIPSAKVDPPNMACFVDEDVLLRNIKVKPYVSAVSPYRSTEEIEKAEIQRRMQLMIEAKGVINLTEVSYVRRAFSNELEALEESSTSGGGGGGALRKRPSRIPILSNHTINRNQSFFPIKQERHKPCLEIIMENGLQIKLEAYSSDTCDLWVNYLSQIIVYWKARKEAEKDAHSASHYTTNKAVEHKHRRKVNLADTRIWSYCLYEQCRDIVKSGILYYKPRKRGTYSKKIFILTSNGWILFYDVYNRGSMKKVCNYEKKGALDIAGCYFYSGVDCSKKKKGSNVNEHQPFKKLSRIYGNGLTTDDDPLSCMFSIWKPNIHRYFSTKRQRLRVYQRDQRINPSGTTYTFLARSRKEKEEWVYALNAVTEHMIRSDIR
ncbi:Pleckstrin homology domain-containing protein [Cokeromyces recurvatus]|uniref:Pleckstrin homology domain-containing protein n=1 Tax=Cokeromyces recurvatus TaxID=90255 RepID=UPI002220D9A5|nr:Pleckstrin homology domain-containing protein [Cokeromyces recurvatus]KAI7907449.1 Pleckstrin homology domain-containing protein [Cokeromyces recurvatus]